MVNDLLKIFKNAENMEKAVLDNYIPKDGTYFRLNQDNTIKRLTIKRNQTEQNELYQWFKEADYYSNILGTDKALDCPYKKIHSNNYYTVFMKCDILPKIGINKGKILTQEQFEEALEIYFKAFSKEAKKDTKKIIETIKIQEINLEELESCKKRIKEAIPKVIQEIQENNLADKNYIKIFIEQNMENYRREGNRYFYQKIFNDNQYNVEIDEEIWGLSNDNMRIK